MSPVRDKLPIPVSAHTCASAGVWHHWTVKVYLKKQTWPWWEICSLGGEKGHQKVLSTTALYLWKVRAPVCLWGRGRRAIISWLFFFCFAMYVLLGLLFIKESRKTLWKWILKKSGNLLRNSGPMSTWLFYRKISEYCRQIYFFFQWSKQMQIGLIWKWILNIISTS